jgi:hypothetical protein
MEDKEAGARELLDVLTRSDADRAALIGRLSQRADAEWLAELLVLGEPHAPRAFALAAQIRSTVRVPHPRGRHGDVEGCLGVCTRGGVRSCPTSSAGGQKDVHGLRLLPP